jgi:hypothetical protein
VDRQSEQIAPAVAEDPVFPFSIEAFQAEVEFLRQFARTRPAAVAAQVGQMEASPDTATGLETGPASGSRFVQRTTGSVDYAPVAVAQRTEQ